MNRGRKLTLVEIDFSAVFDCENTYRLSFKLLDEGVDGVVMQSVADFFERLRIVVDSAYNDEMSVISDVPQGIVFESVLVILFISKLIVSRIFSKPETSD